MGGINIYLDIDGVLNRYGPVRRGRTGADPVDPDEDEWSAYTSAGGVLMWPPEMMARINRLLAAPEVTPYWLTTWESEAAVFGEQVGLEGSADWTWLPSRGLSADGRWQKFASIRDHVDQTDPIFAVWLDDDLAHESEARRWARRSGRVLAFAPEPMVGLRPSELARIEELVAEALRTGRSPMAGRALRIPGGGRRRTARGD
ncbi:HAD domain-containing protein [Acidipropionibacterium virtanenii]|uniref:Uncharacterized protein n=1 Tax=Acidipropionibacterium virtanenii TaxID=2057246 RepID=A0A344USS6_9ACTN|nr:HAD domain-containing protein [Acidipropionibacterium virtanenii]AXE38324.1 hypothetical protein JS278_01144 [Acidipropionibacterium virtanenii]